MNDQIFLKMFFFFLVFLLLNCSIINCISLVRSRATGHSNTNRIIHASLTDKDTGRVWQMQEWVYSGSPRAGRIEIKSDENEVNVFYSYKNSRDNNIRLVIHDNECDLYNYGLKWENLLPGVNKPLTNLILLLGPSLLDRFSAFDWANGNDEIIRGSLMHSVSTDLDGKLNITLYYENNLNQINGIQQPSRIVFTGHNPETLVEGEVETLILDIYLQSQTEQRLDKLVQVTPGFGCPVYLHGDKAFPELNSVKIHFIAAEQINNRYIGVNEFHADETYQVVRQSLLEKGYLQEMIYDYHLATRYHISIHGCYASPISSDAPGMEESGSFSIARLLWLSKTLKYLGQIIFEHRSGYNVHVWESTETNQVINGETYDKVVTTQYLSPSYQYDIFNRYSLVAASIKGYHKNDKGSYVLSYSSHRDYYDSNSDLPESEYHAALQVEDCFKKPEERLNLKFHLTCKDSERCIEKSQDSVYEMRELFRSSLLGQPGISSTRVSDIQFKFQKEVIEVDVTFLQAPQISEVLPSEPETLQPQSISKLHETVASSAEECLQYHSSFVPSGPVIIHCVHGNVCFSTKSAKDIKRGSGIGCYIYTDPFKKLNRLGQEKRLSDLHDHILGYFGHITFNMDLDEKAKAVAFQVTDVIAQNEGDEVRKQPFETLYHKKQFDEIDGVHTVMVPGVNRFGDCYRACSQNEDIPCETFSFCNRKDKKECAVSIWSESQIKNNFTGDSDCTIYSKIHFFDYNVRRNLKYKHPTTVFKESSIRDCASECHASEDCVSFQHCRGLKCSFGGYATSANTEFYEGCDIYILKSSEKYKITGTKLVRQVLYTEVDLDLEQCAAICDDDQSCKSFNFCPKGKAPSQCQITSYSMKDPKTESVDSSICHNFELPVKSKAEAISDNSPDIKVSGVSGGGVFGIIMLCLFIGLFAGFICPYAYTKVKSRDINKSKVDFGWSKHEDDDESQTQI